MKENEARKFIIIRIKIKEKFSRNESFPSFHHHQRQTKDSRAQFGYKKNEIKAFRNAGLQPQS